MSLPVLTKLTRVLSDGSKQDIWINRNHVICVELPHLKARDGSNASVALSKFDKTLHVEETPERVNLMLGLLE